MTVSIDVAADGVRVPLSRERVRALAEHVLRAERVRDGMISIAFVTPAAIARLNREHLGHRGATDVISFGLAPGTDRGSVVGDIYIAPSVARENALRHGARVREEIGRLIVHGLLHVLGHDHPKGDERTGSPMWRRQEARLRRAMAALGW